jgi:hypothetical protein
LSENDTLRGPLLNIAEDADDLRKMIVATKEGGAITGEERLREHLDYVYGAIMSVESRPTPYQLARIDALERELRDVENSFSVLERGKLATLNAQLKSKGIEQISLISPIVPENGGGGAARGIARGLVGLRLGDFGMLRSGQDHEERE